MARPVVTSELEYRRAQSRDIAALKRRGRPSVLRGTAAERDEHYGVPTTAAEQLALAGSVWTDSTLGLRFRYYSLFSTPGAIPNLSAAAAGWYPCDERMPYVLVDKQANQTIASTAWTQVLLRTTTPGYDPFAMWSAASPNRLTVPFSGLWRANFKIRTNGVVGATAILRRDGTEYARSRTADVGAAGAAMTAMSDVPVYAAAGSYLELWIVMAAVTSQTILANETTLELTYMGPPPT